MANNIEITRAQFQKYERVRKSGDTNMFDVRNVQMLSGLDRVTIIAIMEQYSDLMVRFPSVREG